MSSCITAASLAIAFVVGDARGQELVHAFKGGVRYEHLGASLAGGPDVNGDGIGDFAIGSPGQLAFGPAGKVQIFSGRDDSLLATLTGVADEGFGGSVRWCGDLDGDGLSEIAVGITSAGNGIGKVEIYTSSTWTLLRTLTVSGSDCLGWSMADAGDVDGDGFHDLLVGERGDVDVGTVTLFSGKDGSTLLSIDSSVAHKGFGQSVAVVGDANGDGVADYAIGSPDFDVNSQFDNAGAIDLRSGTDGSLLWQQVGSSQWVNGPYGGFWDGDRLGVKVDAAGDVDGDGKADVVGGTDDADYTAILSGNDGSFLRKIMLWQTRSGLAALGDLTGDGLPELGVSYSDVNASFAILSGSDSKVIWRTDGFAGDPPGAVAPTEDVNGDGLHDLLLGFPNHGLDVKGRAELRTTNDLWLDASVHHPGLYAQYIDLRANEGPTGNLAALVLTGVNGNPTFDVLTINTFDATRSALFFSGKVPGGLNGLTVDLRALAIGPSGKLIQSADEEIVIQ